MLFAADINNVKRMSVSRCLIHTDAIGLHETFINITFGVFPLPSFGKASAAANGLL